MSQLVHFPADADPDRIQAQLVADGAVILDGRLSHAILLELFTDGGVGTLIGRSGSPAA